MKNLSPVYFKRRVVDGHIQDHKAYFEVRLILAEANKLGISMIEIPGTGIFELEYKGIKRHFRNLIPYQSSDLAYYSCKNKEITRNLLQHAGISISSGYTIRETDSFEYLGKVFHQLEKPLVMKPVLGHRGQEVHMNINTVEEFYLIASTLTQSRESKGDVLVEETALGKEYRILATDKKVIGIINRVPANVTGNGINTVEELIEIKNADPRRSDDPGDPLVKIKVDDHVVKYMKICGLKLKDIPKKGEVVYLRQNSNISTGGDSIDVTDDAHSSVKEIAMKVMRAIPGLVFGGIDFMTHDITTQQDEKSYCIIEVNTSPGFSIHQTPYVGKNRHPAIEFLHLMFPELTNYNLHES